MEIEAELYSSVQKRIVYVIYFCVCIQLRQEVSQGALEMTFEENYPVLLKLW